MASIKLNKDVTIVWRDGKNYRINTNVEATVPNSLVDYIITSQSYFGSVLSFTKDEVAPPIVVNSISEEVKFSDIIIPEIVSPVLNNTITIEANTELFPTEETLTAELIEIETDKKQFDVLSQLIEKTKIKKQTQTEIITEPKSKKKTTKTVVK